MPLKSKFLSLLNKYRANTKCYPERQLIAAYAGQTLSLSGVKPFVVTRFACKVVFLWDKMLLLHCDHALTHDLATLYSVAAAAGEGKEGRKEGKSPSLRFCEHKKRSVIRR